MLYYFVMKSASLCSLGVDPLKIEVSYLKKLIGNEISANEENIILIANGGLCIQEGILGSYNCAYNEENPVFVYLRQHKKVTTDVIEDSDINMDFANYREKLKMTIMKPGNSFLVLQENEILSASILESSKQINLKIRLKIRNQFLLVEGWNAALANLYDSLSSVEKRIDAMKANLDKFFYHGLEDGFKIMEKFALCKAEMENVPLLPSLFNCSDKGDGENQHPINLLQWVLAHDSLTRPQITVQSIISEAHEAYNGLLGISEENTVGIEQLKDQWGKMGLVGTAYKNIELGRALIDQGKPMQSIIDEDNEEVERVVEKETHTSTKEFLKRLDYLTGVREASEKLVSLIQTHKEYMEHTVRQCKDSGGYTVLIDHCDSARNQLENVNKQYSQLREYLNRVDRSKCDLTTNIDSRKTWLQKFQTKICEVDDSLFLVKERMKRVRTGLRVLDQMQTSPLVYAKGVTEIARRQHYLDFWYSWGIQCSKSAQEIRRKDHEARMLLEQDLENHFVQSLFNSLYSFSLPKLGAPLLQSSKPVLPIVTEVDLEKLSEHLPQFKSIITIEKIDLTSSFTNSPCNDLLNNEDQPLKSPPSKSISREVSNGLSLLPVPDDQHLNIDELFLSHQEQKISDTAISSDSVSNMVKSIDSMDFQLTNDATTETKKDIVCIPRSMLETLAHSVQELKLKLNITKDSIAKDFQEQYSSNEQVRRLATSITESCNLDQQVHSTSLSGSVNINKSTEMISDERTSSNSFQIFHKEFVHGDQVCFVGQLVNGTLQWRMISTDNRIYFLNDSCFVTTSINRRQRSESSNDQRVADLQTHDNSDMAMSQFIPQIGSSNTSLFVMPIVKGIFISKEEYMCKKTTNRYGLPIKTKFFRVQANIDWPAGRMANN